MSMPRPPCTFGASAIAKVLGCSVAVKKPRHDHATQIDPGQAGTGRELLVVGRDVFVCVPLPERGRVTLGRSDGADVTLDDQLASRMHAALHLGERLEIEDLGSANGTRVRGERATAGMRLPLALGEPFHVGALVLMVQRGAAADRAARATATADPGVLIVDDAMRALHALVARVAGTQINVLLLGETGVGKEVIAEAIHRASPRAEKPLLRLNCAVLTEPLLESELFGHEQGAFTGAVRAKPGLVENADGGTVFLDEVGEMPLPIQARLLRVIETRQVQRVGGLRPRQVDVRFVAATNRDLDAEQKKGTFRSDLFFRLNGFQIVIPPLRERPGEIAPLARHFARLAWRSAGLPAEPVFAPETLQRLLQHRWPGNVRELRNVVERALILCTNGTVRPEHLPSEIRAGAPPLAEISADPAAEAPRPSDLGSQVAALEKQRILDALEACAGNQSEAARRLGISRRSLITRLDAYAIPRPRKGRAR